MKYIRQVVFHEMSFDSCVCLCVHICVCVMHLLNFELGFWAGTLIWEGTGLEEQCSCIIGMWT